MSIADHIHPAQRAVHIERRHGRDDDYTGPERRHSHSQTHAPHHRFAPPIDPASPITHADLVALHARLDRGSDRMDAMQEELTANTQVTTEVRDLLATARGGMRVLGWIGSAGMWAAKFAGIAATAGIALYSAWYAITHGGQLPPKQ